MAMYFFLKNKTTKTITLKALGLTIKPNEIRAIKRETFLKVHIKLRNEGVLPKIKFVSQREYIQYKGNKKPQKNIQEQPQVEVKQEKQEQVASINAQTTEEQTTEEQTAEEQTAEETTEQPAKKRRSSRKKQKKEDEKWCLKY